MSVSIRRVLVIEDDVGVRTLFQAVLGRAGYEVEHARNGEDGLSKLEANNYSAVILDLMMPSVGGLQLLDQLGDSNPDLLKKVIIATGASRSYVEKVDISRIHALIRKPFDIDTLLHAVLTCGEKSSEA